MQQALVEKMLSLLPEEHRALIAQTMGSSDPDAIKSGITEMIAPMISQLSAREGGLSSILASLDRDGDGSFIDDIAAQLFSGSTTGGGMMGLLSGLIGAGSSASSPQSSLLGLLGGMLGQGSENGAAMGEQAIDTEPKQAQMGGQLFALLPVLMPVALKALSTLRAEAPDDASFEEALRSGTPPAAAA